MVPKQRKNKAQIAAARVKAAKAKKKSEEEQQQKNEFIANFLTPNIMPRFEDTIQPMYERRKVIASLLLSDPHELESCTQAIKQLISHMRPNENPNVAFAGCVEFYSQTTMLDPLMEEITKIGGIEQGIILSCVAAHAEPMRLSR